MEVRKGDSHLCRKVTVPLSRPAQTSVLDELRFAVRGFARSKVSAAILLVSLALGTGANAVLYSVMNALLFQPPGGVADASRLVTVFTSRFEGAANGFTSYPDFETLSAQHGPIDRIAAFDDARMERVALGDSVQRVRVTAVSDGFFTALGLAPHAGALLTAGGATGGRSPAVISYALWTAAGSPAIAGQSLRVGTEDYTLVGVAPKGFIGLHLDREGHLWIPLTESERARGRGDRRFSVIARLSPDSALEHVQRQVEAIGVTLAERFPETNRGTLSDPNEPRRFIAVAYSRLDASSRRQVILISAIMMGTTGLLLFSACVNAGSLLLSRSAARRRELAVKVALGASRRLLVRQVVLESLCVSLAGACLGLLFAQWTAGLLPAWFAPEEAELLDTRLHPVVIAVTVVLACIAAALFSIGPARHATQTVDTDVLRSDAGGITTRSGGGALRRIVVSVQVALSTILLVAAVLLLQALSVALAGELGAESRDVAFALIRTPGVREGDVVRGIQYHTAAGQMAQKIPGAVASGWVGTLPAVRAATQAFEVDVVRPGVTERMEVDVNVATTGYFDAMKIALVEGRFFDAGDGALAEPVVIVNDALARRFFGPAALGRRLRDPTGAEFAIVGVVRTAKYRTLQDAVEPMVYFPLSQRTPEYVHLVVRSGAERSMVAGALRTGLTSVDAAVDVRQIATLDQHLREVLSVERLLTTAVAASGLAALVLATIGVYGVMDDRVRRRTPEIGLRVALGANHAEIRQLVFREGLNLSAAGALGGVVCAALMARVARVFVDSLPMVGLANLSIVPAALILIVAVAAVLPMRRALRVSPTIALRAET